MKTMTRILLAAFFLSLTPTTHVCAQTKIETPAQRKARIESEAEAKKQQQQQGAALRKKWEAERTRLFQELEDDMVLVEGGTFMMGMGTNRSAEKPIHQVILPSYYICKYEVTQELWQAVMGSNPSKYKGSKRPVEQVSRKECLQFIKMLNQLTGKQYRLPTEAEWEFAARGGNRSKGYQYAGSDSIGDVAWYNGNSDSKTHNVGLKLANELGLYDMSGNVCELCQDWYAPYYSESQTNPQGPSEKDDRVRKTECCSHVVERGGCWFNRPVSSEWPSGGCEVWYRNTWHSHSGYENLGLRLAESRQDEEAKQRELETLENAAQEQTAKEQAAREQTEQDKLEKERAARKQNTWFSEGFAVYQKEKYGRYGYINETGDVIIPCTWMEANQFHEGLARVKDYNKQYGFIDKTGKVVIPCQWKHAGDFNEGLAYIMDDNGMYGFIDKTGKVVLPCIWGGARSFSEGLAPVQNIMNGATWGFIDKTGKLVIPFGKWSDANSFKDGLAKVCKGVYSDAKWGIIDKTGKYVISCKWKWTGYPSEGLCVVQSDRKYGYVNEKGKLVIPCQWKYAWEFNNGVAHVEDENGNTHTIDKTGKVVK